MKRYLRNSKVIGVILVISVLGNVILIQERISSKKFEEIQIGNDFNTYVTNFQSAIRYMDKVIKKHDQENYYYLLSTSEFIRELSPQVMANYYGDKELEELSNSIITLSSQLSEIVTFYFVDPALSPVSSSHQESLQEIQANFQLLSKELNELRLNNQVYYGLFESTELTQLIYETVERNEEIMENVNLIE